MLSVSVLPKLHGTNKRDSRRFYMLSVSVLPKPAFDQLGEQK